RTEVPATRPARVAQMAGDQRVAARTRSLGVTDGGGGIDEPVSWTRSGTGLAGCGVRRMATTHRTKKIAATTPITSNRPLQLLCSRSGPHSTYPVTICHST